METTWSSATLRPPRPAAARSSCASRCCASRSRSATIGPAARWPTSSLPAGLGPTDYIGAFAVTAGIGVDDLVKRYERDHDDYRAIMVKALADRLAEAFAEMLHARVRGEWGYESGEALSNDDLIAERYRGIRPAFGYPACPDHSEKFRLFDLLDARAAGLDLTE